jgi:hypothetical protein
LPRTLRVPQAQEAHDIRAAVGVVWGLHEEAPCRRDAAAGGEMVVGERDAQDGRLPAGRPGAHRQRQQGEARLLYPDDGAPFVARFFSRVVNST